MALAVVGASILLCTLSSVVIAREFEVADAQAALEADAIAVEGGAPHATSSIIDTAAPPRAVIIDAVRVARTAERTADPVARRARLDLARHAIDVAGKARPGWGDVGIAAAYVAAVGDGATSAAATTALRQSYVTAPYARNAAAWRVASGIGAWNVLDPETRNAVIDEAVWLSGSTYDAQVAVLDLMRGSPAYAPFLLRWREARLRDR